MEPRVIRDSSWVQSLFGRGTGARDAGYRNLRRWSNARLSFSDTSMGGSQAINAPPQFTLLADPPFTGVFARPWDASRSDGKSWLESQYSRGSYREGLYYNETIEQNSTYLHCRFGKPKYIGVAAFFANMYDSKVAYLARTGDYPGVIRGVAAYATAAAVWAITGTVAFIAILIIPQILKSALNKDVSRYYCVKPTMHLYLRAVQSVLNTQLVHRRLVPTGLFGMFPLKNDIDSKANKYHDDRTELYAALPDIWKDSGEFDVYKMVNRYQTLANYQRQQIDVIMEKAPDPETAAKEIEKFYLEASYTLGHVQAAAKYEVSLSAMEKIFQRDKGYWAGFEDPDAQENAAYEKLNGVYNGATAAGATGKAFEDMGERARREAEENMRQLERNRAQAEALQNGAGAEGDPTTEQVQSWMDSGKRKNWETVLGYYATMAKREAEEVFDSITTQAASEIRNGSQWVSWKVDARDTRNFTLSNSTKEPEISSTVNSVTQKARSLEVNLSGGVTGFDPVDGLITGLKSAFTGALDFLHLSGIMSLYNSSVVDFPEVWDSSSMSGDDFTFTIPCRAWSGNDLDVFQDIVVPVSFWLAAVAPLSTGKQSFTHPFYLEAYSRGRFSGRNCIVSNLSFNFGVGGLGWRPVDNVPLSVDINVTIRDLSRNFHMPLVTDPSAFDTDNKFSEFMSILGAASLSERVHGLTKLQMGLSQWKQSWKSAWSVGARVNQVFDLPPVRVLANLLSPPAR